METALVTGAAGFIGSHLVEGLRERGYRVRGIDNLSTGRRANLAAVWDDPGFSFLEGDVRDRSAVERATEGVDCVFHLAARTSVPGSFDQPAETTAVNCTGTATVLAAASEHDARVVLASSAAVYGSDVAVPTPEDAPLSPESPYALSKRYDEQLATQVNVEAVALRYFNVFGARQDASGSYAAVVPAFVERLRAGDPPTIYGDGEQTRDFVHVADVVDATVRAGKCDCAGEVLNVGCGRAISINELARTLADVLDRDAEPVHESRREGDVRHSRADISRARRLLEYEPQVSLAAGLERTVEAGATGEP